MPEHVELIEQLAATRTIDITTTGRKTGQPARIEIWWFLVDGRFIITGTPGPRDWFANLLADPAITIHTPFGDYHGRAVPITDKILRHQAFSSPELSWYESQTELDALVTGAPMVEVTLDLSGQEVGREPSGGAPHD